MEWPVSARVAEHRGSVDQGKLSSDCEDTVREHRFLLPLCVRTRAVEATLITLHSASVFSQDQ